MNYENVLAAINRILEEFENVESYDPANLEIDEWWTHRKAYMLSPVTVRPQRRSTAPTNETFRPWNA